MRSEPQPNRSRIATAQRVVRRRIGVAAVVSRGPDRAADDRGLLVQQVLHGQREREVLGDVEPQSRIEEIKRRNLAEVHRPAAERTAAGCRKRARESRAIAVDDVIRLLHHLVDVAPQNRQVDVVDSERVAQRPLELRLERTGERAVDAVKARAFAVEAARGRLELRIEGVVADEVKCPATILLRSYCHGG